MSVDKQDFDSISEQDLLELVNTGVPEGLKIDYKRTLYGKSDQDIREALKDISSFANSSGGHLILGVEENTGIPTTLIGISGVDPDAEVLRLDQIVRSGIEPRIFGLRIKAVLLTNENYAFVLRIAKSWNPPHRVSAKNTNRFYMRNSGGVHEASVEELRRLFIMSSNIRDNIHAFREKRVREMVSGQGPMLLDDNGRIILHIVPLSAFETSEQIDLKDAFQQQEMFRPIGSMGYTPRFNFDGLLIYQGGGVKTDGYTQILRNGILEAIKANLTTEQNDRRYISARWLCKLILEALPNYIKGLQALSVSTPIVVMLTLEGIKGVYLIVNNGPFPDQRYPIDRSELYLPEVLFEEYGRKEEYQKALRPAFDILWNTVGFAASGYFNDENIFIGD